MTITITRTGKSKLDFRHLRLINQEFWNLLLQSILYSDPRIHQEKYFQGVCSLRKMTIYNSQQWIYFEKKLI